MKIRTVDAARGRWPSVLVMLGVDEKFLKNHHGPCPSCGGKDRFRFDDKGGTGTYICSQCGGGNGFRLLELVHGWDFSRAAREVDAVAGNARESVSTVPQSQAQKVASIKRLLDRSMKIEQGDPVWVYLKNRLGQVPMDKLSDLRFCPDCQHRESGARLPAMLAILRGPSGNGVSVHRTYLTMDGHKAAVEPVRKIMPGLPITGAAVRLGSPIAGQPLGIAEGIETALAASIMHGHPVWAAISAGGVASWKPTEAGRPIIVYGDNDENFRGQSAAYALANKLVTSGHPVSVMVPGVVGQDWCDAL